MGTVKLGDDYLLWIETDTPGTFVYVDGQGTLNVKRSRASIDTGSKTTGGWATSTGGLRSGEASLEINPTLPDTGYGFLEALAKGGQEKRIQVRKGGVAGTDADKVLDVQVSITGFDDTLGKGDVVKTSATMPFAAAPTVDALS